MFGNFLKTNHHVRRAGVASPNLVKHTIQSIRQQRGWTSYANGWRGPYATRYGTWHGQIEQAGGLLRPYILNPPTKLQRHPKWPCFHHQDRRPGWWFIHLHTQPADRSIDSVILYVERLITEAFSN
jgi:hypothetical protein